MVLTVFYMVLLDFYFPIIDSGNTTEFLTNDPEYCCLTAITYYLLQYFGKLLRIFCVCSCAVYEERHFLPSSQWLFACDSSVRGGEQAPGSGARSARAAHSSTSLCQVQEIFLVSSLLTVFIMNWF